MEVIEEVSCQSGSTVDVVTGATGHVGNNLVRELLARGRRVRTLVRDADSPSLRGLDVEKTIGDVRDIDSLRRTFKGAEIVYHLAAEISIQGDHGGLVPEVNIGGARNAARAALECGVRRMVHCSSVHGFQQAPLDQPLDESRARVPQHSRLPAYDRSKAAGEAEVRAVIAEGLDAVIVHPSAVIGRNDFEPSRMGRALIAMFDGSLPALVNGGFDWVDVRDLVAGTISAASRGRAGESYILSGHWRSMTALANLVRDIAGGRPPRLVSPMSLARIGAPVVEVCARISGREPLYTSESLRALRANRSLSRDKARRELGYEVRPIEETIADFFRWIQPRIEGRQ